ncbi:hypothetical protein [uncultured Gammaproteobacteria bacterium]|nr:hypothetical protein [uncultured Gammaproteobacteria bacterium]
MCKSKFFGKSIFLNIFLLFWLQGLFDLDFFCFYSFFSDFFLFFPLRLRRIKRLRACNDKLVFFFILSLSLLKNYFRKISVIYKIHHYREKYFQRIG